MTAGINNGDLIGGRWRLGHQLGQGAFGQVFEASDQSTLGLGAAAVKVLHPRTSPQERAAFHDEIRKIVAMRHPNLVAYLDSGEYIDDDGAAHLYLVTELCQYSLGDYLAGQPDGRVTVEQAERLLADMAAGLGYLHSRGLLHRDLKPANVLLGGGDWKLGDFGLTRDMTATGHYHHGDTLMGTPLYMSPELFDRGAASPASDVYAVGVTIHQALTGRALHEVGSDMALIARVATMPPAIDRSLPPHWRALIERCTDRDPSLRPGASQLPAVLADARLRPSPELQSLSGSSPLASGGIGPAPAGGHPGWPGTDQRSAAIAGAVAAHPGSGGSGQAGPPPGSDAFTRVSPFTPGSPPSPNRLPLIGALVVAGLVAVGGLAAAIKAFGGDNTQTTTSSSVEGTGADSSTPVASVEVSADGGTGSTLVDDNAVREAEKRVAGIVPGPADAPDGYLYEIDPPGDDEFCVGVRTPRVAFPGLASGGVIYTNASAGQLFVDRAWVHADATAATEALGYATGLAASCDGKSLGGADAASVWKLTPLTDVTVSGADEMHAALYEVQGGPASLAAVITIYARAGNVVVLSSGSDRAATIYYAELMLARATNQVAPPKVEPTGEVGTVAPGNASQVRVALAAPGVGASDNLTEWLRNHTNADIDTAANAACAALAAAQTPADAGAGLVSAYEGLPAATRGQLTSDDYAQLAGGGAVFYCPDEVQRLGG